MSNPIKQRPVLKLKLGRSSSSAPPDPVVVPKPSPPRKPAPTAIPKPVSAEDTRKRRALAMQETLVQRFPAAFKTQGQPRLPLKIGIYDDIISLARDLPEAEVKNAIRLYVNQGPYNRVIIEGAARVDLNGEPAGSVTAEHAEWAKIKLGRRSAKPA
jgi:ProP effector